MRLRFIMVPLVLVTISCLVDVRPPGNRFMRSVATAAEGDVIDLTALTDFPWSEVHVLPSTSSRPVIESTLHAVFAGAQEEPTLPEDRGALFIFVHEHRVVHTFLLPERVATADLCFHPRSFGKASARFEVRGIYQGQPARWIQPVVTVHPA